MDDTMTSDKSKKEAGGGLLRLLLGPFCERAGPGLGEIGGMFTEYSNKLVVPWLRNNLEKILAKARPMLGGKQTRPLPPKTALAFVEAASKEDDESLQTMWANLLCKYLIDGAEKRESFVRILSRLSPMEAKIFNELYQFARSIKPEERPNRGLCKEGVRGIKNKFDLSEEDYVVAHQNMLSVGIIAYPSSKFDFIDSPDRNHFIRDDSLLIISGLGIAFGDYVIAPGLTEGDNGG